MAMCVFVFVVCVHPCLMAGLCPYLPAGRAVTGAWSSVGTVSVWSPQNGPRTRVWLSSSGEPYNPSTM